LSFTLDSFLIVQFFLLGKRFKNGKGKKKKKKALLVTNYYIYHAASGTLPSTDELVCS
jgi:hypothetical protein